MPWLLALPGRILFRLVRILPRWAALGLFERVGRLAWLSRRRRSAGRLHLARAFPGLPPQQRDRIGRRSCGQVARSVGEAVVLAARYTPASGMALVDFEPGARELLDRRLGSPTVFVQGHFGAMEVLDAILGVLGHRILTPMRMPTNHYVGRDLVAARAGWGVELTPRAGALRRLMAHLRGGGSVVLAADQNAHHAPLFVPWFGHPAASDRAAAYLALRMGMPLVVSWCVRTSGGRRFLVGCEEVPIADLTAPKADPKDEDTLAAVTAGVHRALERAIRRFPEQYLWIHERYRTRPPEEAAARP